MTTPSRRVDPGVFLILFLALALGVNFAYAAVQGEFGLFRRAEIDARNRVLAGELAEVQREVARMENLTLRLSDTYLDLDLLDEQSRRVLGLIRRDEIVIR